MMPMPTPSGKLIRLASAQYAGAGVATEVWHMARSSPGDMVDVGRQQLISSGIDDSHAFVLFASLLALGYAIGSLRSTSSD